ncbi:hypothetical protein [Vulcanisaeta sp. JCM 16161]|uniref:hypothetical protein n=1 Tax=Vulcanisaeta sp. JCM 16161 TaxID=1295372 RepID=UPI0006CFB440|nr:hypothetical protein [Vulcanisaeta sp. JCM 16161]
MAKNPSWINERGIGTVRISLDKGKAITYRAWTYEKRELSFNNGMSELRIKGKAHVELRAPEEYIKGLCGIIVDFMRSEGRKYDFVSLRAPLDVIKHFIPPPNVCKCSLENSLMRVREIINNSTANKVVLFLSTSEFLAGSADVDEYVFTDGNIVIRDDVMMFSGTKAHHNLLYSIEVHGSTWSIIIEGIVDAELYMYVHAPRELWDTIINGIKEAVGNRDVEIINEDEDYEEDGVEELNEEDEDSNYDFVIGPN